MKYSLFQVAALGFHWEISSQTILHINLLSDWLTWAPYLNKISTLTLWCFVKSDHDFSMMMFLRSELKRCTVNVSLPLKRTAFKSLKLKARQGSFIYVAQFWRCPWCLAEPQCPFLYLQFWWCWAGCVLWRMLLILWPIADVLVIIN